MNEADVLKMLLARRDNYGITHVGPYRGRVYALSMQGQDYKGVILAHSFEYYTRRYHLGRELPTLIICFEHDTVTPVPVLSMRAGRLAQAYDLPEGMPDLVSHRHSKTGAQVLVGAYLSGMRQAQDILNDLPPSTRRRYLRTARDLGRRTRGKPVAAHPAPSQETAS